VSRGKKIVKKQVAPSPMAFKVAQPVDLKREATTDSQKDFLENTIKYGADNAFPLKLAKAVEDSPATSACIRTISKFIKGASFSDKELMKVKVNNRGQTLWDLHTCLSKSLALFEGFAMNFKYNKGLKIDNIFDMAFESLRFVKPQDALATEINEIKYNPYYGTIEYNQEYTKCYNLFNPDKVKEQHATEGNKYPGQVYYYGTTSPLHRFYPYPTYYSAKNWIEADAKFQEFMNQELENGFFQSAILNMIGNPSDDSTHPDDQQVYEEDGIKKTRSIRTVGQRFNIQMSQTFSGAKKAGTVMTFWANNKDTSPQIEAFPGEIMSDRLIAQQDLTTKNITIATNVMAILANISEGVSLGSGGSEIQKAVEIMQSNTVDQRVLLEQLYNEVILPNLQVDGQEISLEGREVKIVNYNPITVPIEINKEIWAWLNDQERAEFVKKNMPDITLFRTSMSVQQSINPDTGEVAPAPTQPPPNEALKNINMQQITRIQKIVAKYVLGLTEPTNPNALTYDQAKVILMGYGLTDIEVQAFLPIPEQQLAS
jgi:hypothetical protein